MVIQNSPNRRWRGVGLVAVAAMAVPAIAAGVLGGGSADADQAGSAYVPVNPCRLVDTRAGANNVGPRTTPLTTSAATFAVAGSNGNCTGASAVPANATAVAMNVTIVNPTAQSNLRLYPAGAAAVPTVSNLNWVAGAPPQANKVDVKLSSTGAVAVKNAAGRVDVILDVVGYYSPDAFQVVGGAPGPCRSRGPRRPGGAAGRPRSARSGGAHRSRRAGRCPGAGRSRRRSGTTGSGWAAGRTG
jgi:hypothetical protein